jgi:hypothetical protein
MSGSAEAVPCDVECGREGEAAPSGDFGRDAVQRLWSTIIAILLAIGARVADAAPTATDTQIAYSRRLGVEVFVRDPGGGWCQRELTMRVVAKEASFFASADFADLVRKVGSEVIAKQCATAEKLLIAGFSQGSDEPRQRGHAIKADGWAVAGFLQAQAAAATAAGSQAGDGEPPSDLLDAAERGDLATVERSLAKGGAVDVRDAADRTALYKASRHGHGTVVQTLLGRGAVVDARSRDGTTPLMAAAAFGHGTVVNLLLARGADVGARDRDGQTALMYASLGGKLEVVQALLAGGAAVDVKANDGTTAAVLAADEGHDAIVQALRAAAAVGSGPVKATARTYEQWEECRTRAAASVNAMEVGRQGMEEAIERQCGSRPVREAGTERGVGVRPDDLVRSKTWRKKFMAITGDQYDALVKRLHVTSETVLEDGWIVGRGNAPHAGTIDEAALAIDARTGRVFAAIMVDGKRLYGFGFGEAWTDAPPSLQRWAQKLGLKPVASRAQGDPRPFEDPGACPFECCVYRDWVAEKDIPIYAERSTDSPVLARLQKGESVTALTGVVVTTRPGLARVTRSLSLDGVRAKVGDVVELLTYGGEGTYKLRFQGRVIGPNGDYMNSLTITASPESVWWVKVKSKRGQTGWSNAPDAFGNKDACG